jgi:hypothetical protein
MLDLRVKRQQLLSFLLRHGRSYPSGKNWTKGFVPRRDHVRCRSRRRFVTPQQLMAFLGLVPSERTTGDTVRRGSITKTGSRRARRALVEGAWTYRYPARVSETLRSRIRGRPLTVRTIAWKAQVRLCARYRRLIANGKKPAVAASRPAASMDHPLISSTGRS